MKDGVTLINKKTLDGFFRYATEEARKLVAQNARCACVLDRVVFGWAIHYFEEDEIEGTLNSCLYVLRSYYYNTEENVSNAVAQIKNLLSVKDGVNFSEYGALANYLIAVKDCISNTSDVEECMQLMLKNFRENEIDSNIEFNIMYHNRMSLDTEEQAKELTAFKEKLVNEINAKKEKIFLDNSVDDMKKFIVYADSNKSKFTGKSSLHRNGTVETD